MNNTTRTYVCIHSTTLDLQYSAPKRGSSNQRGSTNYPQRARTKFLFNISVRYIFFGLVQTLVYIFYNISNTKFSSSTSLNQNECFLSCEIVWIDASAATRRDWNISERHISEGKTISALDNKLCATGIIYVYKKFNGICTTS